VNKLKKKQEEKPKASAAPKAAKTPGAGVKLSRGLISVLNGSFLTRENVLGNMRFILFVAGLMLCYIAYGYWTERTVRQLDRTNRELKEMRSEYITVRSHLEQAEQQSHVADGISGMGLRESRVPPRRLEVPEDQLEAAR
jgi:hypothetical protein